MCSNRSFHIRSQSTFSVRSFHLWNQTFDAKLGLVIILLFCSGFCALIFETAWIRLLRGLFGATMEASAAVVATFMGGIGLGSTIIGTRAYNSQPLRFFALLQFGICVLAWLSISLFDGVQGLYITLGGREALGQFVATVFRVCFALLVLGAPAILIGATLPVAVASIATASDIRGRRVAICYGLNTLGSALGIACCTFLLLPNLGTRQTIHLTCLLSFALGVSAWWASRNSSLGFKPPATVSIPHETTRVGRDLVSRRVYTLAFFCGFVFFVMETIWFRTLTPLLGGTIFAVCMVLFWALAGLGIGGVANHLLSRWIKPEFWVVGMTSLAMAGVIGIPFFIGDLIPMWLVQHQSSVSELRGQLASANIVAAFVVLPAACVSGFQFPILPAISPTPASNSSTRLRLTLLANTFGGVAGSIFGGFVLIPTFGAVTTWRWIIIAITIMGLLLITLASRPISVRPLLGSGVFAVILTICSVCYLGPTAVWRHSEIGARRGLFPRESSTNAKREWINAQRRRVIHEQDGRDASVAITTTDSLSIVVDGKSDGNAIHDAGTQIGLGLLGPILHPQGRTALVVGLGTGETAGWLAEVPWITKVEVVEIEKAVTRMAQLCGPINCKVMENRKVVLSTNDARETLLTRKDQFDFIVSEPSNPYRVGVAALYTVEFYKAVSRRLERDGLFIQWLQAYEIDFRTFAVVVKTLYAVFPSIEVWRTGGGDLLFVCARGQQDRFNLDQVRLRLANPHIRAGLLHAWRVADIEGFLAHYVGGDRLLKELMTQEAFRQLQINSDNHNRLEFQFASLLGGGTQFSADRLLSTAIRIEDDLPVGAGNIDRRVLARRRIAMNTFFGEQSASFLLPQTSSVHYASGMSSYLKGDFTEVVQQLLGTPAEDLCPVTCGVIAHSMGEIGLQPPPVIISSLKEYSRVDAIAIQAISAWKARRIDESIQALQLLIDLLYEDPWGSRVLIQKCLEILVDIAAEDPKARRLFFERVSKPFAMFRCETVRRSVRYDLASELGSASIVDALKDLEPYVPWQGFLLEKRAGAYKETGHPLCSKARHDLARYRASLP